MIRKSIVSLVASILRVPLLFPQENQDCSTKVSEMRDGQVGYTVSWALMVAPKGEDLEWCINPLYPVYNQSGGTTLVRVVFTSSRGYEASLPTEDYWKYPYNYEWELDEEPSEGWLPITVHAPEDIRSYLKLA